MGLAGLFSTLASAIIFMNNKEKKEVKVDDHKKEKKGKIIGLK
jgi:hypothetical protein